jgi:methyl-accepting chemotaxis protein
MVSVILTALTVYYTVTDIAYITAVDLENARSAAATGGQAQYPNYLDKVTQVHSALFWRVGSGMVVLVATGIFLTIFFMHRICGPVYRFEKILRAAASGQMPDGMNLRKNDEFKNLADSLVNTLHATREAGIEVGKKTAALEALSPPEGGFPDQSDSAEPQEEPASDQSSSKEGEDSDENGEEVSDVVESSSS